MKWQCVMVALVAWQLAAAEETETWYDAKGQPVGELPADAARTTQPSDLVANDRALIRAQGEPWNAARRYRRLRDWYLGPWYPFGNWTIGTGWFYRSPYVRPQVHGGAYRPSCNTWNFSYRSPGFYLQWHR